MEILLSIVVPIYNVEPYIYKCLSSIIPQIKDNMRTELILVNDGTKDNSAVIAGHIIEGLANAKLINQNNQGLSVARNNGMDIAKGKFIWFIDSDDWIESNSIECLMLELENDIDILQIPHQEVSVNGFKRIASRPTWMGTQPGKDNIDCIPILAQLSIYRLDFLRNYDLRFMPGIYHEDSEFKPRALYFAASVKWHDKIVYNYYRHSENSITGVFKFKNAIDIITVNKNLIDFKNRNVIERSCRHAFSRLIGMNLNTLLYGMRVLGKSDYSSIVNLLASNKYQFKEMLASNNIKLFFEGFAFLLDIRLGVFLHKIIR